MRVFTTPDVTVIDSYPPCVVGVVELVGESFTDLENTRLALSCGGNFIRNKQLHPAVFGLAVNTNARVNLYLFSMKEDKNSIIKTEIGCYNMKKGFT